MATTRARRATADIALHFARHYPGRTNEDGEEERLTLRELADEYGVTPARMRTALRLSRDFLRRQGLVCTVPIRDDRYVIVVTSDKAEVAYRILHRLVPIITEILRHSEDWITVDPGSTTFNPLIEALYDIADALGEMTENSV